MNFDVPYSSLEIPLTIGQPLQPAAFLAPRTISRRFPPLRDTDSIPAAYRDSVRRIRNQYRQLYELPMVEYADGSRSFHDGRLFRRHGVNILLLRGDFTEMAFQHGRLLAHQILLGALPQSANLICDEAANTLGCGRKFRDLVLEPLQRLFVRRMMNASSAFISRAIDDDQSLPEAIALCDATGISTNELFQAFLNPEILMVLAKFWEDITAVWDRFAGIWIPPTCCTSLAAWGKRTREGKLLIGHNTDYPLNGYYDRFPTVIYFEPTVPGLRFMSFTSAGIHNAGVTSYNEAGVFLTSHVVPSTTVSLRGVPAMRAADVAIRRSDTFATAVDLFRQLPSAAGWVYFLASAREQKIGSLELARHHFAVRMAENDCHVQTNQYHTPELRDCNLFINRSVDEDSEGRFLRIQQRLAQADGQLDAAEAVAILGDQFDPVANQIRALGNTVGDHINMSSMVIDPAHGRALVSSGMAPACHSDFVELPLIGTFEFRDFPAMACSVTPADGFATAHPEKVAALRIFIQAKTAYETKNDAARAYELMKEVVRNDASNPAYFFQLGILALLTERFDDACRAFDDVFRCSYITGQLRRLAHYYRGRALADGGKVKEAEADLATVLNDRDTDQKLRTATLRAIRKIRIFGRCRLRQGSLVLMMQQSDMLNY